MKAALALIFFACFAGSMATSMPLEGLFGQGQSIIQAVVGQLQQQISAMVQQALGHINTLLGSGISRFNFNFNLSSILDAFKPILEQLAGTAVTSLIGDLSGIMGGM
jgi:hypothetical protein